MIEPRPQTKGFYVECQIHAIHEKVNIIDFFIKGDTYKLVYWNDRILSEDSIKGQIKDLQNVILTGHIAYTIKMKCQP